MNEYKELASDFFNKLYLFKNINHQKEIDGSFKGEIFTLLYLYKEEECKLPSDISCEMNISTARVTAILNTLEEKGFIERKIDNKDRRKIQVKLTSKGIKESKKHNDKVISNLIDMFELLGRKDSEELLRIISKILDLTTDEKVYEKRKKITRNNKVEMNKYRIKPEEVNRYEVKVKALLVNDKDEVLLGYANNGYQLIGGKHEGRATLSKSLIREIKEETGIKIPYEEFKPFFVLDNYIKDKSSKGLNRFIRIYYYKISTDIEPNFDKMSLTESEKEKDFELKKVKLKDLSKVIEDNVKEFGDEKGIAKEMFKMLKYLDLNKDKKL